MSKSELTPRATLPTYCSIATPIATPTTPARDVIKRLAVLEAEQQWLLDNSLSIMQSSNLPLPALPVQSGMQPWAQSKSAPASAARSVASSSPLLTSTGPAPLARPSSAPIIGQHVLRLEDENLRLREAVAQAELRNLELAIRKDAAELRSLRLEEENRRAYVVSTVLVDVPGASGYGGEVTPAGSASSAGGRRYGGSFDSLPEESGGGTPVGRQHTFSLGSVATTSATTVVAASLEAEARRNLFAATDAADRKLREVLSRRGDLQALLASPADDADIGPFVGTSGEALLAAPAEDSPLGGALGEVGWSSAARRRG